MAVMFRLFIFLSKLTVTELAGLAAACCNCCSAIRVFIGFFNMLEKEGHRIFAAVREYLPIQFRNLEDAKTVEAARFMKLTQLCIGSALFSFFSKYQEGLEVGVKNK